MSIKHQPTVERYEAIRQDILAAIAKLSERRATEIHQERTAVLVIDPDEVGQALRDFAPVWETLTPQEQTRVVGLLVARVDYDDKAGTVVVTFRPTGIMAVAA